MARLLVQQVMMLYQDSLRLALSRTAGSLRITVRMRMRIQS
jgi:hypothetical protein